MTDTDNLAKGKRRKDGFIIADNEFLLSSGLSPNEKVLYLILDVYANKDKQCFPSLNTLMGAMNATKPTVIKTLDSLIEKGLLIKETRFKSNNEKTSNLYTLRDFEDKEEIKPIPIKNDSLNTPIKSTNEKSPYQLGADKATGNEINSLEINTIRDIVAETISLVNLRETFPNDSTLEEIYELIVEVLTSKSEYIRIAKENMPAEKVKSVFWKLNNFHVQYLLESLKKNTNKAKNIKAYILTSLYNTKNTLNIYYQNQVQADLYGDK